MNRFWKIRDRSDGFDLEKALRTQRATPRPEFVKGLSAEMRGSRARRPGLTQLGLALAVAGLIVIAIASFGGVGYASSNVPPSSAADAQYGNFLPPKAPKGVLAAEKKVARTPAAVPTKAKLPFTGLALWVPMALGIGLIAAGLGLRTRGRRRNSSA